MEGGVEGRVEVSQRPGFLAAQLLTSPDCQDIWSLVQVPKVPTAAMGVGEGEEVA